MKTTEAQKHRDTTKKTMLYILIAIMAVRIISYFMLSESVAVTQTFKVGLRFFTTAWCVLLVIIHSRNSSSRLSFKHPLPINFYLAYLSLGVISLLWTSSFEVSMLQLLMDAECLAFAFLFMRIIFFSHTQEEWFRLVSRVVAFSVLIITFGFIAGKYINPEKFYRLTHGGEVARLGGFIINPNELGMLLVIGIAMMLAHAEKHANKILPVILVSTLVYALVLTGSRSSLIALVLVVFVWLQSKSSLLLKTGLIAAIMIAIPALFHYVFIKNNDVSEVLSMTGRIPFWKDLLSINFPKEPWFGYGFMRIDYHDRFESLNSYSGAMTHNTFLQVLMNLGIVGLTIVLLQLATTVYAMTKIKDSKHRFAALGIFIPVLVNSFTEFGIFGEANYGIMFYLMLVFMVSYQREKSLLFSEQKLTKNKSTGHSASQLQIA